MNAPYFHDTYSRNSNTNKTISKETMQMSFQIGCRSMMEHYYFIPVLDANVNEVIVKIDETVKIKIKVQKM